MTLYKIQPKKSATISDHETTINDGPFLVSAQSPELAIELLCLNFLSAALRSVHNGLVPQAMWSDDGAHEWAIISDVSEASIRQTELFDGADISESYLKQPTLVVDRATVARMIWWPLGNKVTCPV